MESKLNVKPELDIWVDFIDNLLSGEKNVGNIVSKTNQSLVGMKGYLKN